MAINEQGLKEILHGIVDWIPFTREELKTEFHALVEDLDGSVTAATKAAPIVPATDDAIAGETVTADTPAVSVPTAQENAAAVAEALSPSLNAIATALGNLAPQTTAPEGVPSS